MFVLWAPPTSLRSFTSTMAVHLSRGAATASTSGRSPVAPCRQSPRRATAVHVGQFGGRGAPGAMPEVNNDPEKLFAGVPVREGLIQRRMMIKQMEVDKDFAKAMSGAQDDLRKEQLLRRETRRPPANHEEIVEYFLNTQADDLEYEVAKYRPRLTPDFFAYLDTVLGAERFSAKPDEDRLGELDLLRKYLLEAAEAVDKCVVATSSAVERVKKLLTAKDKKAMILDMAANNEIDQALMDLLQQNIDMAKAADQEEPAKFMEKVKVACAKYMISAATQAQLPQVPDQLGTRNIPVLGAGAPAAAASTTPAEEPIAVLAKKAVRAPVPILTANKPEPVAAGKLIL